MIRLLIIIFTFIYCFTTYSQTYQWANKKKFSQYTWGQKIGVDKVGNSYCLTEFSSTGHSPGPVGFIISKYNSGGGLMWEQQISNYVTSNQTPRNFKVDESGNLYLMTTGSLTIGGQNYNTFNYTSTTLFKLDSDFNLLWFKCFKAEGNAIVLDDEKNVYLTGFITGMTTFGTFNFDNTADSSVNAGIFVVKYDSFGNCKWARSDGSWLSQGKRIGLDKQGNITITGTFYGDCIFDSDTLSDPNGRNFIAQYDNNGTFKWARKINAYSHTFSIASDDNSNIYISGTFNLTALFGTYSFTTTDSEIFVAKYNTSGNVIWAKSYGGPGFENCYTSVMVKNELLIAGAFKNSITFDSYQLNTLNNGNYFIAKIDTSGTCIWAIKQQEPSLGFNRINCIETIDGDDIFITGEFSDQITFGATTFTTTGTSHCFVSKMKINGGINGISTVNKKDDYFTAYPNPTKNILTIIYKGSADHLTLKLLNSQGQGLYTEVPPAATINYLKEIDLSKYPKGIYFVQLSTGSTSEVRKIVLE